VTIDPVARALAYPFAAPPASYALGGGDVLPLPEGRTIVLAYGANGDPSVLRRKLGPRERVVALAGTLHDFDAVYSAHISPYGAVPATLRRVPGRALPAWALLLTEAQLGRLAQTEPNYNLRRLDDVRFESEELAVEQAHAFVSRHGALAVDGAPVRLADRTQREVQELVRARLAPDEELEAFIAANAADSARAARFTAILRRDGIPFDDV
jgi:hypothetical protein